MGFPLLPFAKLLICRALYNGVRRSNASEVRKRQSEHAAADTDEAPFSFTPCVPLVERRVRDHNVESSNTAVCGLRMLYSSQDQLLACSTSQLPLKPRSLQDKAACRRFCYLNRQYLRHFLAANAPCITCTTSLRLARRLQAGLRSSLSPLRGAELLSRGTAGVHFLPFLWLAAAEEQVNRIESERPHTYRRGCLLDRDIVSVPKAVHAFQGQRQPEITNAYCLLTEPEIRLSCKLEAIQCHVL